MRRFGAITFFILVLVGVGVSWRRHRALLQDSLQVAAVLSTVTSGSDIPDSSPTNDVTETNTPEQPKDVITEKKSAILHRMPFATQAPGGVWDAFHEEMCEEASMVLLWRYWLSDSNTGIADTEMSKYLNEIALWERENVGTDISTTLADSQRGLIEYFGIPASNLSLHEVTSAEQIRDLLQRGPLLAPFAGKLLGNPNFRNGGPRYHMAVIIGFRDSIFITHEVGTRLGAFYEYSAETILTSLHDFIPEKEGDITQGKQVVLLLER